MKLHILISVHEPLRELDRCAEDRGRTLCAAGRVACSAGRRLSPAYFVLVAPTHGLH